MANDQALMSVGPALQDSTVPTWVMTMAGDLICANDAFVQFIGLSAMALTTQPLKGGLMPDADELDGVLDSLHLAENGRLECCLAFHRAGQGLSEHDCVLRTVISGGKPVAITGRIRQETLSSASVQPQTATQTRHDLNILRMLRETVGIATWSCDLRDRLIWASDNYYQMLGYGVGEVSLSSQWVRANIHPDELDEAILRMEEMIAGQRDAYAIDYRLRCKDGSWKWFHATAHIRGAGDVANNPTIYGSMIDITARKADEARLQEALHDSETAYAMLTHKEEMHRIATESGGIAPWNVDPISREAWWSDGFHRLLGYDNGALAPTSYAFRDLIHPKDRDQAVAALDAVTDGTTDFYDVDFRMRRADGSWIWCQSTARLLSRDHLGQTPLLCGSLKDITPRKLFEQQIATALAEAEGARDEALAARAAAQKSAEILRISSESGNVVPWTRIPENGESWFGDNLAQLLGYPPDTVIESAAFRKLFHPDDLSAAAQNHDEIERGERNDYDQEFRILHADGTYRWFASRGRKLSRESEGLPYIVCGSLTNIDPLKENEERLAQVAIEADEARVKAQTSEDMLRASAVNGLIGPWNLTHGGSEGWMMDMTYRMMGYEPDEFAPTGEAWRDLIHPDDREVSVADFMKLLSGDINVYDSVHRLRHKDGSYHWYRAIASRIDRSAQGLPNMIAGANTPIDHLKENEKRLAEAATMAQRITERLTSIADNAPAGLFEVRLDPDGLGDFPYTSGRFNDLIGYTAEEVAALRMGIMRRVHPDDLKAVMLSMDESMRELRQWGHRFRYIHPENGETWIAGSATPRRQADGSMVWVGTIYDVTNDVTREAELRKAHQAAEQMRAENEMQALHDVLTDLPNRRYFDQILAARLSRARSGEGPNDCVLIRIDADRFKYINDTLGHDAGDQVLIRIARLMQQSTRASDFSARIGGDEFSIILAPGSTETDAARIVDRIQQVMAKPLLFNGRQCHIRASFGIAHVADIAAVGSEIQSFADAALYRAKEKGRNRMEFFTPELHRDFIDGQSLASELYDALERDEFVPFFQPQVAADDGRLTGVEAVVRWQHPQKGLLSPARFLKVAEQLKMVADIDRRMVEKSTEVLSRLQGRNLHLPKISFNVSSGRLHDSDLIGQARQISRNGTMVTFELVESVLVEEAGAEFKQHLQRIKGAGINIEIDDFGSGHASIIGLMEVLPSALKIDRRIVTPVAERDISAQLVKAIIQIADALGIATVAEGGETVAQAQALRKLGCDVFQGFLFAPPLSEADLAAYLTSGGRLTS